MKNCQHTLLILAFGCISSFNLASQECTDLMISEVVEGWSNNKAIEIYNPTSETMNLAGYGVIRFQNGSTTPGNPIDLSEVVIDPFDVYVIVIDKRDPDGVSFEAQVWEELQLQADTFVNPSYNDGQAVMYFNGNDALALTKDNGQTLVDVFGKIGDSLNPDGWGGYIDSGGEQAYVSKDHTLVRKSNILQGYISNPISFDILNEYDSLPANTFTQLGFHLCDCETLTESGCMDSSACNFDNEASVDDGSCFFIGASCDDLNSNTFNDEYQLDCSCSGEFLIQGCTNSAFCNYNPNAQVEDGSCAFVTGASCDDENANTENDVVLEDCSCFGTEIMISGCTDIEACNFNVDANFDDGSCSYLESYDIEGEASGVLFNYATYNYQFTEGSLYDWTAEGGAIDSGQGSSEIELIWAVEGLGSVCVIETNSNGCVSSESCKNVAIIPTSVDDLSDKSEILIYPNPVVDFLTIDITNDLGEINYKIINLTGQFIQKREILSSNKIDVSKLPSGLYYIEIDLNTGAVLSQKFMKK